MLIDDVTITVKAGDGGNGASTFKRNGQTAKGGPDGGNGGNGGDVFVQGVSDIGALTQFQYKKSLKAEDGVKGGKNNLYGKNAEPLILYVPAGTSITDTVTQETFDVTDTTTQHLLAKGGIGGRGNNSFKSSTNQAPVFAERGTLGEEKELHLTLRLIADIGLIGLPNAGKSSLLEALTNARPKIANYPFTTLEPNLGMMGKIVIADIPGLIEGASSGKGLGIKFLKHIERTKLLIHCIDSSQEHPYETYKTIRREFEKYNPRLLEKNEIIFLTKSDLIDETLMQRRELELQETKRPIYPVSVIDDASLAKIIQVVEEYVRE